MSVTRFLALFALSSAPSATDWLVAPSGGDFTTIQAALDVAVAGDRVLVEEQPGGYSERLVFPRSGNAVDGFIELTAAPGHRPTLDGTGVPGIWMITLQDRSWIRVRGLEIRNNLNVVNDGSGIRVQGAGAYIELLDNVIHDMRGFGAMAITVYGTSTSASLSNLVIEGNEVYDCEPADSETITLNGNVEQFRVAHNVVRDVNNIGIDFIGGETDINPLFGARNGECVGNVVVRANANYGGGFAAGIYVDGGTDILIEGNVVVGCDLGIEIGAENAGVDVTGVVVSNNLVTNNEKVGIVFGGYDVSVGRVRNSSFVNNVCYANDTLAQGFGELWVQWADDNTVANNVFVCGPQGLLLANYATTSGNTLSHNLWYSTVPNAGFVWDNAFYSGLGAFALGTGQAADSVALDPLLRSVLGPDGLAGTLDEDFRPRGDSPCVDAGDSALAFGSPLDFVGAPRVVGSSVDLGAFEFAALTGTARRIDAFEGGVQSLALAAGPSAGGAFYLCAANFSGTMPGLVLNGIGIPLNYDSAIVTSLTNPNGPLFSGFQGFLDANGDATAQMSFPPGLLTSLVGERINACFVLFQPPNGVTFASNPVGLDVVPY